MKTSEILKKARALIEKPERWTTEVFARDAFGKKCDISKGYSFCSLGALAHIDICDSESIRLLKDAIGEESIAAWNDNALHEEVLAGFDKAIALAEARGQ